MNGAMGRGVGTKDISVITKLYVKGDYEATSDFEGSKSTSKYVVYRLRTKPHSDLATDNDHRKWVQQ